METSKLTKQRITEYLKAGKRFDERELEDYRKITIETGISNMAEGSARVKLGDTDVLVGIKMDVMEPFSDHPDEGVLITSAELLASSSPKYEPGPPRIDAIEMARIVDRGIRESKFIDFKKLCIKEGEKVWSIFIDMYSLNDDGNLLDAFALGVLVALKHAKIPKYNEETEKAVYGEWTDKKIPLTKQIPLTITVHKIGNSFFVDPTTEEEESSEARITFSISDGGAINAMQKGNDSSINIRDFYKIVDFAEKKWRDLYPKIGKLIEEKTK
ncbi:MAG: exosome complex protein Rrp42 [Nanoarchaeota archaeon]